MSVTDLQIQYSGDSVALATQLREAAAQADTAIIAGTSAVLVHENYELIDVVNRYQGQGVLNLLALDGVKEQVDAAIVELFPADREGTPSSPNDGSALGGRHRAADGHR